LRRRQRTDLGLVVIDYLQLMQGEGANRNEEISGITRRLKVMAKDLGCPVIALSQLSRKVEERVNHRPMMSDLRDSGSIEQDADVVLMMYRDEYYNPASEFRGMAEAIITKNRMGTTGTACLVFQPEFSRFRDADQAAVAAIERRTSEAKGAKQYKRGFQ
jgi:replicative DNA helicase